MVSVLDRFRAEIAGLALDKPTLRTDEKRELVSGYVDTIVAVYVACYPNAKVVKQ